MLAARLALQWGIVDVRGWLRTLPRGALDFWEAFDMVEPIGEQWSQTAQLTWASTLDVFKEPKEPDDFMPPRFIRPTKEVAAKLPTQDEAKQQFDSFLGIFGFSGVDDGRND